jgi:DNA-binding transcriptional LysR family regulator
LAEAYRTIAQAEHAVQVAQAVARGELGRLRIGMVSSVAYGGLPETIRVFRTRFPRIAVSLEELTSQELLEGVEAGALDLGFFRADEASVGTSRADRLKQETVYREPFVVALPQAHRLATLQAVPLIRLRDEDFVLFPRTSNPGLHDHLTRHCREKGFEPRIVSEANMMQTLVSLVAAGLGVTLAPASLKNLKRPGVVYRRITHPVIESDIVAVWRRDDDSPMLNAFMAVTRETARWMVPV